MSLYSHDGHQILQYSASVKKVMLVVDVNNFQSPGKPAEDAHNAMLNVTIPPSLIYSAFRSKVRGREADPRPVPRGNFTSEPLLWCVTELIS